MCGIGGCVLSRGARPEHDRLIAMRDALAHRGPDDFGIETIGNVALVHTRLSIVDLSERGHQPMRHPSGRWWLAYNGEIYNHLALRAELNGTPFVGDSDTETLLWALDHWGPAAVSRLTGQFAFAALDVDAGRLLLCRDRFGVKPLYFARFAGGVWFASEPAALVAAGAPAARRRHRLAANLRWVLPARRVDADRGNHASRARSLGFDLDQRPARSRIRTGTSRAATSTASGRRA